MQSLRAKVSHPIFLFSFVTLLGYGLLIPFTGFYWDDWPFAWIAKFLGPSEFIPAFMPFRPFLGPIFYATTSLIPPTPLYWQIFALIIRFLIGLSAWWTFKQIFPARPRFALIIALLITVFPGYSQHWVAYTHINQELIPFIFYILSFGFTFKALRSEHPLPYTILAILLQLCGIFPTEYFFGLEGLRALFLFFLNGNGNFIVRLRSTLKTWWPHFLIWLLNALWLVYYYKYGPYTSYEVTAADNIPMTSFLAEIMDTLWKICFYIWGQVVVLISSNIFAPTSLITLALILITFTVFFFSRQIFDRNTENRTFALSLIVIGVLGILLGRLPSLAAELPLKLQTSYDRFTVSMMIGGSLFIAGLIELIFQNSRIKNIAFITLISLGVGQQFFNANIFRRDWEQQRQIYWQLSWRIPALIPNTVLLTYQMPIDYETDLSFTAPVNWLYAKEITPPNLPYALLYAEKRLGGPTLPSLAPDTKISFNYRTLNFNGSTSQVVVIYMPVNGCLRVLDPSRGDAEIYANQPEILINAIPLSDPSRIITNPSRPASPAFLFNEPKRNWCYYFTKAELAYQTGDLEKVIALENEASINDFAPNDLNEWLIFIEARVLTQDINGARKLSEKILAQDARMRRGVCAAWKQIQTQAQKDASTITEIRHSLQCAR